MSEAKLAPARDPDADAVAPGLGARIGLAVVHPRWALAVAADRRVAGRSGTDLILLIALTVVATQLKALVGAVWLGAEVDGGLGMRAVTRLLTDGLTLHLCFLVLGAVVLWLGAGARRSLGRAFDLACVAAIPLFLVDLAVLTAVRALDAPPPVIVGWLLRGAAWGWAGALFALAWRPARMSPATTPAPPRAVVRPARRAALAVAAIAAASLALHGVWIARNLDLVRPVDDGMPAPRFTLRDIGPAGAPAGAPGAAFTLAPGRVTVLDFWATWCGPCLTAMPKLDALAARHPDVDMIAINLDDAAAARALFDERGWTKLRLVSDDGAVSQRYQVGAIPHTVVIDRGGIVRHVVRGSSASLEAAVRAALARPLSK